MKVFNGFKHIKNLSLALGFFDGIHIGHAVVIKNAVDFAKKNGLFSGVILFGSHPREFFSGQKFKHIIEFNDKISLLNNMDVDYVFIINFNADIAKMSPQDYINLIVRFFEPSAITTGYNHSFGQGGLGSPQTLQQFAKNFNFKYFQIPQITVDNHSVSSTIIRNAIKGSDFELAKKLLGYSFYIKSPVIHGRQIGRTINFPTANLIYPNSIVNVDNGVYLVKVDTHKQSYIGVMNYGLRPTIDKSDFIPVPEVHLLDFSANLYGSIIKVSFIEKIRDEKPFSSLTELKCQIEKDCLFARSYASFNSKI